MAKYVFWVAAGLLAIGLTGCSDTADIDTSGGAGNASVGNGDNDNGDMSDGDTDTDTQVPVTLDRYSLANGCFALGTAAPESRYIEGGDAGSYVASAARPTQAVGFYMKPTGLGRYMFYTPDETLLTVSRGSLSTVDAPADETGWDIDDGAEWTIDTDSQGRFTVVSESADKALAIDRQSGDLQLVASGSDTPGQHLDFAGGEGCAQFPEIGVQATGETFKGNGVDEPVLGFADIHNHISATDFLGGDHVGRPFDKFGVTEALPNGAYVHGDRGLADLVGNLYGGMPTATHDPQGWPTFVDWPARDMLTHEGTYYRWIKRAWLAGLRVLNNNVVENQVLCTVQSTTQNVNLSNIELRKVIKAVRGLSGEFGRRCDSMDNTVGPDEDSFGPYEEVGGQIKFMHRMEDYIDAQNGGPGKGWFRLVESPAEAREVINQGKLAVYLGIEHSHLFGCSVRQPVGLGEGRVPCSREDIDEQLDDIYAQGVRQVNIMHEFNNGFGGNGIFNTFVLNLGNFVDTGSFWQTEACTAIDANYIPSDVSDFLYSPGANLLSLSNPGGVLPSNPLSGLLNLIGGSLALPTYPTDARQCNKRGITELGRYVLDKLMDKGMLLDIDHLSLKMKSQVIDIAKERDYPLISTHGGQGGISNQQAREVFKLGGLIYPMSHDAESVVDDLNAIQPLYEQAMDERAGDPFEFAMGFGADTNGLATQPTQRPEDSQPVTYPFMLFQGPEWGSQFDRVQAVTFDQSVVPEGNRRFSLPDEGVAHYGLFADWVKSIEIAGGKESLDALYSSAEAFLQTWERVQDR